MNKEQIEGLKARLSKLEAERTAIMNLLEVWGESPPIDDGTSVSHRTSKSATSFTTGGRIVDATVELIHKLGRPAKNAEIMEYIREKQLPLGNTATPDRMLAAILNNESKKSGARIRNAARGYWDVRQ